MSPSDPFCSLYQVVHYIKAKYFYKIPLRELGFVHYIEDFTVSRFTISRLGCTTATTTNLYFVNSFDLELTFKLLLAV